MKLLTEKDSEIHHLRGELQALRSQFHTHGHCSSFITELILSLFIIYHSIQRRLVSDTSIIYHRVNLIIVDINKH